MKAFQAAGKSGNDGGGSFFRGGYTGDDDKHKVSTNLGAKSYEYHHREFVVKADLTEKYRFPLLEPLHQNRPQDIRWDAPAMQALLPDYALPQKLREEKQAAMDLRVTHQFAPMQAEFQAMKTELAEIKKHVKTTAERKDIVGTPNDFALIDQQNSNSTHRVITEGGPV